jgi:two-component system response regulator HupR/HoxA
MEKRTVLFVDDEPMILKALKRELSGEPYDLMFADSGINAMNVLCQESIQVVVTDMTMPLVSGLDLLAVLKEKHPHIIRIVLSGHANIEDVLGAVNEGQVYRYIVKPWKNSEELKIVIRQAIDYYNLRYERYELMEFFEQWIEGVEPEAINIEFLKELLKVQKKENHQWKELCKSKPVKGKSEVRAN